MKRIRARQQFSHFNAGTFEQNEERTIPSDMAEALIGMGLADEVEDPAVLQARMDAEAKAKADAAEKEKADAEAKVKADAEAKAKEKAAKK